MRPAVARVLPIVAMALLKLRVHVAWVNSFDRELHVQHEECVQQVVEVAVLEAEVRLAEAQVAPRAQGAMPSR